MVNNQFVPETKTLLLKEAALRRGLTNNDMDIWVGPNIRLKNYSLKKVEFYKCQHDYSYIILALCFDNVEKGTFQ